MEIRMTTVSSAVQDKCDFIMTVLSRLAVTTFRHSNGSLFRGLGRGGPPPGHICRGLRQPRRANRKGGMNLAPELGLETPNEHNMGPGLLKSILFAAGFCGTTFVGVSIWQYESLREKAEKNSWSRWANQQWNSLEGWQHKEGGFRQEINRLWNSLNEGQKVFWPICFLNAVVYGCWNNLSLRSTMFRYFCSNPAARAVCWPMFLSTFSHYAFFHFAINMYVLHSFSSGVTSSLGKEQFLGMYLCGGVISSLASHAFKVASRCPGPSLGASGAIMALLGYFCTTHPNAQLGIVFLPGFTFSADTAIKSVMCLDAVGMALGWRMFDHAAHLGGALFGVLYAYFGPRYIWPKSEPLMRQWHEVRTELSEKIEGKPTKD
ncbi:presenilins-associated rhomboid-like protein, mitochondrial isoform X2 [Macrobrachium rosenbergii]|uniref:presenilins-associated rhomboid-like protein, mitochondrial isoform X2 n=1 Tax=Macrobrachium rosenbergii TaxID=79674 RepID=UPI0034D65E09